MMRIFLSLLVVVIISCQTSATDNTPDLSNKSKTEVEALLTSIEGVQLDKLTLPDGFSIEVYARVNNARQITMGENGTLFISNRSGGAVYAVRDTDGNNKVDEFFTIAEDLNLPNGVAFKDGALFVAEVDKLWRYDNIEDNLENIPTPVLIYEDYPTDRHHGWKYIAFGPDGKLYIPVGAPCNICESKKEIYASITRMDPDGSNREIFAHGVRNSVGFTWHPTTGDLWFTDNGRDALGDEIPPCELNRASEKGQHFGYPYCHGGTISDPEFGSKRSCDEFVQPAQNLGPHVAPLGLKFYTGSLFPSTYTNKIFIAEHGSWNRSSSAGHTGHRITLVTEENGQGTNYEVFMEGFLDKESNEAWGRPVDILVLEDGSMLVSDDKAGAVYRVSYND
ncbi:MAG: sorbosone dehydrogenase family protein [Cyclobacteriaceae bacterium]